MGRMTRINQRSPGDMIEKIQTAKSDSSAPSGRLHTLVRLRTQPEYHDERIVAVLLAALGEATAANPHLILQRLFGLLWLDDEMLRIDVLLDGMGYTKPNDQGVPAAAERTDSKPKP